MLLSPVSQGNKILSQDYASKQLKLYLLLSFVCIKPQVVSSLFALQQCEGLRS